MNASFAAWLFDPRRSLEERFGGELLVEGYINRWCHKHDVKVESDYEADRLRKRRRSLNPAYQPVVSRADAERVEEILPDIKSLSFSQWDDRPLRDLAFLQFCPMVESLSIYSGEIRDWSPVSGLSKLTDLQTTDRVAADFRPIGGLPRLRLLHITAHVPWPDLTCLHQLQNLEDFQFDGNLLALEAIPRLPAVRQAKFCQAGRFNVPLRRAGDLPEMPGLKRLFLENTWRLNGIERYPLLLNLEVNGEFEDLTPLTSLSRLTHLTIKGGTYPTLTPLVKLSELRCLVIRREEPQDYSPLTDLVHLHELRVEGCPVEVAEVATLNAIFSPWSEEFAVDPPRVLEPLRLRIDKRADIKLAASPASPRNWGEDVEMESSEARWFAREINRRLTRLLGKGWGKIDPRFRRHADQEFVTLYRTEDIERLRGAVECLRQLLATARHPWSILLTVDSLDRFEREVEANQSDDDSETFDADQEREEWEYARERQRERREYLEREYRYRLQQEQGTPIRPQDFAPPVRPPAAAAEPIDEADPDPPDDENVPEIFLAATLTESTCHVPEDSRGLAQLLLEIQAEN